ncbi:AsnC family protein [Candidatus Bathyarchaeota archaeon]|nr:MAG: AsnC family protein [Candidatus Bathyarchaeota archaeon]
MLKILRENSRIPTIKIAKMLGVSETAVRFGYKTRKLYSNLRKTKRNELIKDADVVVDGMDFEGL